MASINDSRSTKEIVTRALAASSVPFYLPESEGYERLSQPYNKAIQHKPLAVVYPDNIEHVSRAIKCARAGGVKVQAKGGGHSYGSYSNGGKDGSIVIDMRQYQRVNVDRATGVAIVGAGVRLGRLATELHKQAGRAIPHGTSPHVGVAGHATHGGYGFHSRNWGLALDCIEAVTAVLADGSVVRASSNENTELFAAFRGAADSFGIIAEFQLRTYPAPSEIALFKAHYNTEDYEPSKIANVKQHLDHLQTLAQSPEFIDRCTTFGISIKEGIYTVQGATFLPPAEFQQSSTAKTLFSLPNASFEVHHSTLPWIASLEYFDGQSFTDAPEGATDTFYAKSIVVPTSTPFTSAALDRYFDFVAKNHKSFDPRQVWYTQINLYGGHDSQISVGNESSYAHRDALWVVQNFTYTWSHEPPLLDSSKDFLEGLTKSLQPLEGDVEGGKLQDHKAYGAYVNYLDPALSRDEAQRLYYGDEVLAKLRALKAKVDPEEVFWHPQSIHPA